MPDFAQIAETLRTFWGLWLMVFFVGIVVWVFWPRNRDKLEKHGEIPLKDDDGPNASHEHGRNEHGER